MLLRLVLETSGSPAEPDAHAVLTAIGELDTATAGTLVGSGRDAVLDGYPVVVVDLGGVVFIDSSGIGALLTLHRAGVQHDAYVAVVAPSEQVSRVLSLLGLDQQLHVHPDVPAAVRAGRSV